MWTIEINSERVFQAETIAECQKWMNEMLTDKGQEIAEYVWVKTLFKERQTDMK